MNSMSTLALLLAQEDRRCLDWSLALNLITEQHRNTMPSSI
jgi:hypothetical protein